VCQNNSTACFGSRVLRLAVLITMILAALSLPATQDGAQLAPSFEVASIKLHRSEESHFRMVFAPGRFTATGATVMQLTTEAYGVKDFQVLDGPGWATSTKYDVEAKEPDSVAGELQKLPPQERMQQMRLLLQSLLADRLKLKVSYGTRDLPVYALVVAKGGPKLTPATVSSPGQGATSHGGPMVRLGPGQIPELNAPVSALI
jgi:uncharacterized protein (TIGR03435 family)